MSEKDLHSETINDLSIIFNQVQDSRRHKQLGFQYSLVPFLCITLFFLPLLLCFSLRLLCFIILLFYYFYYVLFIIFSLFFVFFSIILFLNLSLSLFLSCVCALGDSVPRVDSVDGGARRSHLHADHFGDV